jgi:hypothetical protein
MRKAVLTLILTFTLAGCIAHTEASHMAIKMNGQFSALSQNSGSIVLGDVSGGDFPGFWASSLLNSDFHDALQITLDKNKLTATDLKRAKYKLSAKIIDIVHRKGVYGGEHALDAEYKVTIISDGSVVYQKRIKTSSNNPHPTPTVTFTCRGPSCYQSGGASLAGHSTNELQTVTRENIWKFFKGWSNYISGTLKQ